MASHCLSFTCLDRLQLPPLIRARTVTMNFYVLSLLIPTILCAPTPSPVSPAFPLADRAIPHLSIPTLINLRIEGATQTIFESPILSTPRNITTPSSGGPHKCDGTNNLANPSPGATATTALDSASKLAHFTYDATWSAQFEDFFVTSIGPDAQTSTQFWGLLSDFQFTAVGGCQFQPEGQKEVLWAYDAFNAQGFLKLEVEGKRIVKAGGKVKVRVTDGSTGTAVQGAKVGGSTTGSDGRAEVVVGKKGKVVLKAEKTGNIRSNGELVVGL